MVFDIQNKDSTKNFLLEWKFELARLDHDSHANHAECYLV